jgi:hypothetical protein
MDILLYKKHFAKKGFKKQIGINVLQLLIVDKERIFDEGRYDSCSDRTYKQQLNNIIVGIMAPLWLNHKYMTKT